MTGRIYYLQTDNRTIYALRFSGLRDRLPRIRNQTDLIARSFKLSSQVLNKLLLAAHAKALAVKSLECGDLTSTPAAPLCQWRLDATISI